VSSQRICKLYLSGNKYRRLTLQMYRGTATAYRNGELTYRLDEYGLRWLMTYYFFLARVMDNSAQGRLCRIVKTVKPHAASYRGLHCIIMFAAGGACRSAVREENNRSGGPLVRPNHGVFGKRGTSSTHAPPLLWQRL